MLSAVVTLYINYTTVSDDCEANGAISASAFGGNPPYTFTLSTSPAGSFQPTVLDNHTVLYSQLPGQLFVVGAQDSHACKADDAAPLSLLPPGMLFFFNE